MYNFDNAGINKLLIILAAVVVLTLLLSEVVGFIIVVSTLWALSGLAGWGIGRMQNKIDPSENLSKDSVFYDHIARGPIAIFQYLRE
jgi:hypothetical protein